MSSKNEERAIDCEEEEEEGKDRKKAIAGEEKTKRTSRSHGKGTMEGAGLHAPGGPRKGAQEGAGAQVRSGWSTAEQCCAVRREEQEERVSASCPSKSLLLQFHL